MALELDHRGLLEATGTVSLDGRSLTPAGVVAVACDDAPVQLAPEAAARNARAADALASLLARGTEIYGVTTGVGKLRTREVPPHERPGQQLRLLLSHAGGGGALLDAELVRGAMVVRANQLGAGGAGISPPLLDALVDALNAGVVPAARELGSLGTGDLSVLAEIGLSLLGTGFMRRGDAVVPAASALTEAGLAVPALGPRDGLAFISSNAATIAQAALVAHRASRLFDTALSVFALSFAATDADPSVLDARVHAARPHPGQIEVAARVRALVGRRTERWQPAGRPVHDPYPFRCQPQVDGPAWSALEHLHEVLAIELNAAAENALIVADDEVALASGNFHAAGLALALDHFCAGLAQSTSLIAARVGGLLDETVTGLPDMLAARPGADSGAMALEYTAHAAAAAVRSLAAPLSTQSVSISAGVEGHGSLAAHAAARAATCVSRMADTLAVELVVAVRALEVAGRDGAVGEPVRPLLVAARSILSGGIDDRPFTDDMTAARRLIEGGNGW